VFFENALILNKRLILGQPPGQQCQLLPNIMYLGDKLIFPINSHLFLDGLSNTPYC